MKHQSAQPRAQMYLQSETATVCADADTDYAVGGTFVDGNAHFFTLSSPVLTYTGDECLASFNGAAYIKTDKVCKCTMSMYINGSPVFSGGINFQNANSIQSMSFPILLTLTKDNTYQIYIKSNTASTTFTVSQLVCVFQGVQ